MGEYSIAGGTCFKPFRPISILRNFQIYSCLFKIGFALLMTANSMLSGLKSKAILRCQRVLPSTLPVIGFLTRSSSPSLIIRDIEVGEALPIVVDEVEGLVGLALLDGSGGSLLAGPFELCLKGLDFCLMFLCILQESLGHDLGNILEGVSVFTGPEGLEDSKCEVGQEGIGDFNQGCWILEFGVNLDVDFNLRWRGDREWGRQGHG